MEENSIRIKYTLTHINIGGSGRKRKIIWNTTFFVDLAVCVLLKFRCQMKFDAYNILCKYSEKSCKCTHI